MTQKPNIRDRFLQLQASFSLDGLPSDPVEPFTETVDLIQIAVANWVDENEGFLNLTGFAPAEFDALSQIMTDIVNV